MDIYLSLAANATSMSELVPLYGHPATSGSSLDNTSSWHLCNDTVNQNNSGLLCPQTNATNFTGCPGNASCNANEITFAGRYVMAGAVGIIAIFGGINNLLIIIVAMGSPMLRRKTHLLVMNLAVIDFLVTVVFCPLYVCSILLDAWPFSDQLCTMMSIILAHNSGVSLLTNFGIAVNRCLLARGGSGGRLVQTKCIFYGIVFIWIAVFGINVIPVLAGYVKLEYNQQYAYCAPSFHLTPLTHWVVFFSYTYAIVLTCPLLGSCLAYFMVFRSVRGSMLLTRSEFSRRRYIRTSRNLTYLFGVFCVCWLPDTIHFTLDPEGVMVPVYVTRLLIVLFLFNSVLNPFIFAWKFPAFRKSLRFCMLVRMVRRRVSMPSASRSTFSAGNLSPTPSPNPPTHTFIPINQTTSFVGDLLNTTTH